MGFHFSHTSWRISPNNMSVSFFRKPGPISFHTWWWGRLKSSAFSASVSCKATARAQSISLASTSGSLDFLVCCSSLTFRCFSSCSSSAIRRKSVLAVSRSARCFGPAGTACMACFASWRPLFHQPMCLAATAPSQAARKDFGSFSNAFSASSIAHSAASPCSGSSSVPSSSCPSWRTFFLLSASWRKALHRRPWISAALAAGSTGTANARPSTSAANLKRP
mmetsp:Transcript_29060/g.51664  ORF Transcript_29060/g.51664 Transcript_29060/m.51664 type:complete len:222 (-) Transcript_29060:81-746(-)